MSEFTFEIVFVSIQLALVTTLLLLIASIPLAWWMAQSKSRWIAILESLLTLPLVLPPTVIGFYLLLAYSPDGPFGKLTDLLGIESLAFSFSGLVVGSLFYSMPFVLNPILNGFRLQGSRFTDAAATLGASPVTSFRRIAIPIARSSIKAAAILGFAHTIGEFGVVLMIGGNIPGETRVLSTAIYDFVEGQQYTQAHILSTGLLLFSFLVLLFVNKNTSERRVL